MKRKTVIWVSLIVVLALGYGFYYTYNELIKDKDINIVKKDKKEDKEEKENKEEVKKESKKLIEVSYEEFEKLLNEKEEFIILFSKTDCPYCNDFKPKLEDLATEYDLDIYNLECNKITDSEYEKVKSYVQISGFPTLSFFKNKKELGVNYRLVGNKSKTIVIDKLKQLHYIEESLVYEMKDFVGKKYIEVKKELENHNIVVIISKKEIDLNNTNEGVVIEQSVSPGTKLSEGDTVTLYIPDVILKYPDFKNYTLEEVKDFCTENGIILEIVQEENKDYEEGMIFKQSIPEGATVSSGRNLKIYVAK